MKIQDISPENRPRERLESQGPASLSNAELLAIIIKSGTKKENVLEICNKLLSKYGLEELPNTTLNELCEEHGIGKAKACQLIALFELYKRTSCVRKENQSIKQASDIAKIYLPKMKNLKKEQLAAVYLDSKNKIICDQIVTIGTLNTSLIHPREVFHGAIKNLANAIIVLHNHPSGDPTPSKDDLEITERLKETGEVLGIKLLDHIIIGGEGWWSWRESRTI